MSALTAVYDLAVSPPTYDFASFLCEAERVRLGYGHEYLDVVFMPGPDRGFRDDNLPPDVATRESMLWRVCVGMTRLLPSVRNVHVLKERCQVSGQLFPRGWKVTAPVSCYGTYLFRTVPRCLKATEEARRMAASTATGAYVTITRRDSAYWQERNSNTAEWRRAALEIGKMGYEVVWIRDSFSADPHPASLDIDLRLALYHGAVCNLGVSNGPMYLAVLSGSPYLIFKMVTPSCPSTTAAFLASHGLEVGDQLGGNGRLVWEDDTAVAILREFKAFIDGHSADSERVA